MGPALQPFSCISLPQARIYDDKPFPLCLSPPSSAPGLSTSPQNVIDYIHSHSHHILDLLRAHGVILFRGFAAESSTPHHFAQIVSHSLHFENFPYSLGNAVRTPVVGDVVFTANESPPDKPIPFHHELAQTPNYPSKLLFYCDKPADIGGETPVLLSSAVYRDLAAESPDFLAKLETHGVIYSRVMTPQDRPESAIGRGWRATFSAEDRAAVEEKLRAKGYSWEWLGAGEDALLREISPVLHAVAESDGHKAFFNQIYAVWGGWRDEYNEPDKCVTTGNGEPLDSQVMEGLAAIMIRHEVAVPWKRGDFMLIDNMKAQHSRKTFVGKRRVLASLVR